jgi:hypothetical protein
LQIRYIIINLNLIALKHLAVLFSIIVLMAGFTSGVMAQATETTDVAANLVTPIAITETASLHFGTMTVLAGTGGTCVLSTLGDRTQTAGVNLSVQAPVASNASYNVSGAVNTSYSIMLPAKITVKCLSNSMTIGRVVARPASAGADMMIGTLSSAGSDNFTIGGTLNVLPGQAAGLYTGTFSVTVIYN